MPAPLLERVVEVKALVQLTAAFAEHEFLGIPRLDGGQPFLREESLGGLGVESNTKELFERG